MMYFILICILIFVDQVSKHFAVVRLKPKKRWVLIEGKLDLTYLENRGAAYGLFAKYQKGLKVFISLSLCCLIAVFVRNIGVYGHGFDLAMTFLVSGGIGNLIDRYRWGYVIDFIEIKIKKFPVFNLADFFVLMGASMLCVFIVKYDIVWL